MNRRHILESIDLKTTAEYEQIQAEQKEQYRRANDIWPYLSEYGEQFVLRTRTERKGQTEYVFYS